MEQILPGKSYYNNFKNANGVMPPRGKSKKVKMQQITVVCSMCSTVHDLSVNKSGYLKWINKEELIQDALPSLNAETRELLISKVCGKCFKKLTGGFQ